MLGAALGNLRPIPASARSRSGRLEVGRDIPRPDEVRRILASAGPGPWRGFLVTAAFSGLRASELRGLRWSDVDLARGTVHVRVPRQRAQGMEASLPKR